MKDKKYGKVRYYTGEYICAAHNICNLKYSIPKKIPIAFHNISNYNYHLIINDLKKKLQGLIKMEKKLQKIYLHITVYSCCKIHGKFIIKSWQKSFWRNS